MGRMRAPGATVTMVPATWVSMSVGFVDQTIPVVVDTIGIFETAQSPLLQANEVAVQVGVGEIGAGIENGHQHAFAASCRVGQR